MSPPPRVVVLGRRGVAVAAAAALAGELRAAASARAALLCVWAPARSGAAAAAPAAPAPAAPATPAARRLAHRLAARELAATARGRLAWLTLPDEPGAALDAAARAWAATDAPTVLALAGARTAAFTALLHEQDLVVVARTPGDPPGLAALAVAELAPHVAAIACAAPAAGPARLLALAGVGRLPAAREALLALRSDA